MVQIDTTSSSLLIEKFMWQYNPYKKFNYDLFMALLPARPQVINILALIILILRKLKCSNKSNEILHQLIQRLDVWDIVKPLVVLIRWQTHLIPHRSYFLMIRDRSIGSTVFLSEPTDWMDDYRCSSGRQVYFHEPRTVYLCSLLLVELRVDMIPNTSDIAPLYHGKTSPHLDLDYALLIDDIWRTYREQDSVRSFLRLCILSIRHAMSSLDDQSFLSLPVPPYIRTLLTYRDVSEKFCEEWSRIYRIFPPRYSDAYVKCDTFGEPSLFMAGGRVVT